MVTASPREASPLMSLRKASGSACSMGEEAAISLPGEKKLRRSAALGPLARQDAPADDLLVDLAQAVGDQAAEQLEELERGVGVHRQDLLDRRLVERQHGERPRVSLGVGRARLAVDERHLAEEVAPFE